MYHKLAVSLTTLFEQGSSAEEIREQYVYGAELLISSLVDFIILVVTGYVFHRLPETFVFLLFFCPLRSCAGGYHAPSYLSCTLIFSIYYVLICMMVQVMPGEIQMVVIALSVLVILLFAPVEDSNKKLGKRREKVRQKCLCRMGVELIVYMVVVSLLGFGMLSTYITISFGSVCSLLLLGVLRKKWRKQI